MKKVVLIIFISLFTISGCQEKETTKPNFKTITSEEAHTMIENNADIIIVDVRSVEEYNESHIENSINIPVNEIGNKFKEEVTDNLDKTILVYCRSGVRANQASELLIDLGYKNVYNIGGKIEWKYELVD